MKDPDQIRKQNQHTIILLLAAFIVPVVIAYLVYLNTSGVEQTSNGGDLVIPARPLTTLKLSDSNNNAFGIEQLKGSWHLIYMGTGTCAEECLKNLSKIHQVRMSQGKAMSRMKLIYITSNQLAKSERDKLQKKFSRLSVLTVSSEQLTPFKGLFNTGLAVDPMKSGRIYMVDPLGNLMLHYKSEIPLGSMIKDITRLLKNSQIG